jgi:GNAT superfamily N-acetyltransferase
VALNFLVMIRTKLNRMIEIKYAQTDSEFESCWEVVEVLRPHLNKKAYLEAINEMVHEGFRMIYICEDDKPVAFAGFRDMHKLYSGKTIYIDDLCTLPSYRGKGYAGLLLDHIHQLARETGKNAVHLDSGYQRKDAHRLYLNKGYTLASHHFEKRDFD